MSQANVCILVTIFVYIIGIIAVGIYTSRKNNSASDFFLGGRKLGPLVTAMSAEASDMSSYLLMGLPGLAYLSGTADVGWTIIGLAMGTYAAWLFVARRLRRYTQITDSFTLPQFFSNRFHDKKCILTAISAVIIIVFFVPYTAAGFAGCGKLFASLFGMNYTTAMILSACVIVLYTTFGGFTAASLTDFIQSIVMTAAIVAVLVFSVHTAGGVGAILENAKNMQGFVSMTNSFNVDTGNSTPYTFLNIIATLSWALGYFGMPHILLRFMAIEDDTKLKISRRVGSIWVVIAMFLAMSIGIIGKVLSNNGIIPVLQGSSTETVMVQISSFMSQLGVLPALLAGLAMAGILASTMSTADSQLLAASSSVSQNLLQETFHVKVSQKTSMVVARCTVIAIALLGIVFALNPDSSVFGIISFAWAGFGAAFGPTVICSLFWKRVNLKGCICGMIIGSVMVFIWKYLLKPLGGVWGIYELLPAFVLGLLVIITVSLLTEKPSNEICREFELAKSKSRLD